MTTSSRLSRAKPATAPACADLLSPHILFERQTILAELRRQQGHITNTAKALGLERSHLYKKCQQLGIDLQAARSESA
ncbi:MAG TPA: helix-turn-helix domain-containing protein [Terriglobales bacterium]|nr:helix-turn-helix domain-containing protein [Terriglobales bacterium]